MLSLKEKRLKTGIKAKKIAADLGVSRKTLYRIEDKTSKLTIEKANILAKIYNIKIEDIKNCYEVVE